MRILLIVHGYPPGATGGTETYTRDLAVRLAADSRNAVAVLTRESNSNAPQYRVRREHQAGVQIFRINNTFEACASFEESYTNPALLDVAARLIEEIDPDVAHVQHLTCLSVGLPRYLAGRGTPVVMTLNDYWMMCHRGQLFDTEGRRCDGPYDGGCGRCLPAASAAGAASWRAGRFVRSLAVPGADALLRAGMKAAGATASAATTREASAARLACMREASSHVDLFLVPSLTIERHFARFGVARDRLRRCSQGIDVAGFRSTPRTPSTVLRLGFAGSFIPTKAPHVLLDAVSLLPPGTVSVDLIGDHSPYHGDASYERILAPLLGRPFVRRHGPVPHERMPERLGDIDALVVPSVWIENAPFVIREAFAAGAPVIASDLGGMAEMVTHGRDGLLFPAGDARALASAICRLLDEPGLLDRLRAGIEPPLSIEQDAAALVRTYERLSSTGPRRFRSAVPTDAAGAPEAPRLSNVVAVVLNFGTPDQAWLAVRSLQTSFDPPARVLIVDNGSTDESARLLRQSLPGVTLLETGRNLGFAAGSNVGIRAAMAAGADGVLLVNSDVVLAPDALGELIAAAAACEGAGILGPALLSRAEPGTLESAGVAYSASTGRMRHPEAGRRLSALLDGVRDVDAISGCVMLVTRDVFDRVGLLREEYFFSFEDLELCLRAGRAGFRTLCVPRARAYHEGSSSIGRRSARRLYFATRNHLKLAGDVSPSSSVGRLVRGSWIVALNAAYAVTSSDAPLVPGLTAVIRGAWHHLRGRYGAD